MNKLEGTPTDPKGGNYYIPPTSMGQLMLHDFCYNFWNFGNFPQNKIGKNLLLQYKKDNSY